MSNNLINETSPYLLQHKNNPVNWFSWNPQTLSYVKNQKAPVLLSIGYSSCHWCHVMAHESFEDDAIAEFMNKNFINIKVDREERPDVDSLYQASLAIMGQQGGWPLTMFLDNNLVPFWGGTYFPKVTSRGMPSFFEVLHYVSEVYKNQNEQVVNNTAIISRGIEKVYQKKPSVNFSTNDVARCLKTTNSIFDTINGGLKGAPKFPMVPLLRSLFYLSVLGPYGESPSVLKNIKNTVDCICLGGIYDHLGGGFSRYSTDEFWLVPHFEKMLYDNAQLIELLSLMFAFFPSELYKNRVEASYAWLSSNMLSLKNNYHGYFSAIDADSDGSEGEFYVWDYDEIISVLGKDSKEFVENYSVLKQGNWEGKNILHRINKRGEKDFVIEFSKKNQKFKERLLKKRSLKKKPFIDKKILTDCNSMLVCGFLRAYVAFDDVKFLHEAERVYGYIFNNHFLKNKLYHSSCGGIVGAEATIDDYANFIKASFVFYETTGDIKKLNFAKELLGIVSEQFYNNKIGDFSFANKYNKDLFLKTTNTMDNATQSGSGLMLENLIKEFYYFQKNENLELIESLLKNNWGSVCENPISHISYVYAAHFWLSSHQFVALLKKDSFGKEIKRALLRLGGLSVVWYFYEEGLIPKKSPAFGKKYIDNKSTLYVCRGSVCSNPITNIEEFNLWMRENVNMV